MAMSRNFRLVFAAAFCGCCALLSAADLSPKVGWRIRLKDGSVVTAANAAEKGISVRADVKRLDDGEMLDPGTMECASRKVDFLIRGVYAAEGSYRVAKQPALPAVMHSVWRAPGPRSLLQPLSVRIMV